MADSSPAISSAGAAEARTTVELDIDDYHCPVCLQLITGHILQCHEGHIICRPCLDSLRIPRKCPTCSMSYEGGRPARNRLLEGVVARMRIPCKYQCGFSSQPCKMQGHWLVCHQREVKCPRADCSEAMPFNALPVHFMDEHGQSYSAQDAENVFNIGKLGNLDQFTGFDPKMANCGAEGNFVLTKINYATNKRMDVTDGGACEFIQVRSFHSSSPVHVTVQIRSRGNVVAQGPRALSEPMAAETDSTDSLRRLVERGDPRGVHIFFRQQVENVVRDGSIVVHTTYSTEEAHMISSDDEASRTQGRRRVRRRRNGDAAEYVVPDDRGDARAGPVPGLASMQRA